MGKVDVISAVFESFDLIRKHYKEVALPIIILILLSGAGGLGTQSFSRGYGGGEKTPLAGAALANSMDGAGTGILALGSLLFAIIVIVAVAALVFIVVSEATQLYIYEHFYAILRKKKIKEKWTGRFGRLAGKSVVMLVFRLIVFGAVFIIPILQIWNFVSNLQTVSAEGIIGAIVSVAITLIASFIVMLAINFALAPLWVYYAMDGAGFFDSIGKSVRLVSGNFSAFFVLWFVFVMLGIATMGAAALSACCCLSWVVAPILGVGVGLLYGVTMMKVKLAIEK